MPAAERKFRIRITAESEDALGDLPLEQIDRGCTGGIRRQPDGSVELEAIVSDRVLDEIQRGKRIRAEVLADVEEEGKRKQAQVGRGNRFEGDVRIPRGLGKKTRERGDQ